MDNKEQRNLSVRKIDVITTAQAAKLLGCTRHTVNNLIHQNILDAYQHKGQWCLDKSSVVSLAEALKDIESRYSDQLKGLKRSFLTKHKLLQQEKKKD